MGHLCGNNVRGNVSFLELTIAQKQFPLFVLMIRSGIHIPLRNIVKMFFLFKGLLPL